MLEAEIWRAVLGRLVILLLRQWRGGIPRKGNAEGANTLVRLMLGAEGMVLMAVCQQLRPQVCYVAGGKSQGFYLAEFAIARFRGYKGA